MISLVIGPEGRARAFFEWLRQRVAVNGLDFFDPVRGPKYLGTRKTTGNFGRGRGSSRVRRGDGLDDGECCKSILPQRQESAQTTKKSSSGGGLASAAW